MPDHMPLIPEQRQQEVLRLLRGDSVLSIRFLADVLGVSHMTVRRDIAALEESGMVDSVQGGVRLVSHVGAHPPRARGSRAAFELTRKRAIAALAGELVSDDMVVFLDAGTTCEAVVPHLTARQGVTVLTNDFATIASLFDHPALDVIHTGGDVDAESRSSAGPLAAATVSAVAVDLAFLSTGAWDLAHGVTTPELDKVTLKTAAMAAASRCVLLADSTKFGAHERFKVAPLSAFDVIVSDDDLPRDARSVIADGGVELLLVTP